MKPSKCGIVYWLILLHFIVSCFGQDDKKSCEFALPTHVVPEFYRVMIITSMTDEFYFSGNVQIKIRCDEATSEIVMNAEELTISDDDVTVIPDGENTRIEIDSRSYDNDCDLYIIKLKTSLEQNKHYWLHIPFKANLDNGQTGYFTISYTDENGNVRWIAMTLLDPTYTRQVFPCWDDIRIKANFVILLEHDANLTALSNMMVEKSADVETKPGWKLTEFKKTPPIPPSHVAFVLVDFVSKEQKDPETGVLYRVWARKELINQADLGLDTLMKAIPVDAKLFDMAYPLEKMDIVALPNYDGGFEACLGLGLITEAGLLFEENKNSLYNRRSIVSVVCAMVTYQWCIGIVTPKDWNGIWLLLGMSNYFAKTVVDTLYPAWIMGYFTFANEFFDILSASDHSLQLEIKDPKTISQYLDTTTFTKGTYMMRMLSVIVGHEAFVKGVIMFLHAFQFKKADQSDFWKVLQSVNTARDINIEEIMNPWTRKEGFPLLNVSIDYDNGLVLVKQERFLFEDKTDEEAKKRQEYCWAVPLTYTTSIELNFDDMTIKQWINCQGPLSFPLQLIKNDWLILNVGLVAPCRINYSKDNWNSIFKTLFDKTLFKNIELRSRMQIMDDIFAFAAADIIEYTVAFNIIKYLSHEDELGPWGVALGYLSDFRSYFRRTSLYESMNVYMRNLLTPVYTTLGRFGEIPQDYYLGEYKFQLTFWSCEYIVDACREDSLNALRSWKNVPNPDAKNPIRLEIREIAYCMALRIGDESDWEFLFQRFQNARGPLEKAIILRGLGCIRKVPVLQKLLNMSIDPKIFKPQESPRVFGLVMDSGVAYEICKEFVISRFQEIYNYLDGNPEFLGAYLPLLFAVSRTKQEIQELNNFVDTIRPQLKGTEKALQDNIIYANFILGWLDKYTPIFTKILTEN